MRNGRLCPGAPLLSLILLLALMTAAAPASPDSANGEKGTGVVSGSARPVPARAANRRAESRIVSSTERAEIKKVAARLIDAADAGRLVFVNQSRDRKQLDQLAGLDAGSSPPLTLELLRTLDTLAQKSTPEKPVQVMSIFRPLSPGRPTEPHGN